MSFLQRLKQNLGLFAIMAGGICFRLLGIDRPFLGNFSSYQTLWAMMARFMAREHFLDLLNIKLNVLIMGKPSLHLLAYPVSAFVAAVPYAVFGGSLEVWGRLQAVFFSILTVVVLYFFVKKILNKTIALTAAFIYAFSPVSIIYGQSFMDEACSVFLVVLALYMLYSDYERPSLWRFFVSAFAASFAVLSRIHTLYLLIPAAYIFYLSYGRLFFLKPKCIFYACLVLFIPFLWYGYTLYATLCYDNVYTNMFVQMLYTKGRQLAYLSSFNFYKTLLDYVSGIDFTPLGFVALIAGIVAMAGRPRYERGFFYAWLGTVILFFLILPQKVMDHNFYTLHLIPVGSVFAALSFSELLTLEFWGVRRTKVVLSIGAIGIFLLLSFRYTLHPLRVISPESMNVQKAAEEIRRITGEDDRIIAARGAAGDLLYYCDRKGWLFSLANESANVSKWFAINRWDKLSPAERERRNEAAKDPVSYLEYLKGEGARYFVVSYPPEFLALKNFSAYMSGHYRQLSSEPERYLIFDLGERR
ncbi:MAG: glycosyltransferase family 39 protein [Candidatus Omnitrophica bacterium]|nr:glycosyltransferase family 39 protein [Candidatus Omnitrophota bacterium]